MMSSKTYLNASNTVSKYFDTDLKCTVVEKEYTVYNRDVFEYIKANNWPGIPEILDISENDDTLTIKERWIDGIDLESFVRLNGPMKEYQVVDIITQLCDILEPLHDNDIIHRDIKPSNVLQTENGIILIDFNAGKTVNNLETRDTVLLGTAGFAAPEQYGFRASSIETDIYGLGALAQYLFVGNLETSSLMTGKIIPIISKCMELNPSDRYKSVKELRVALFGRSVIKINSSEEESKQPIQKNLYRYFFPVGFRSGKLSHYISATLWYLFVFWLGLNLKVVDQTENSLSLGQMRFSFILIFILPVFFHFNYLNIQQKIGIKRNANPIFFWIKITVYDFILMFLTMFFLAVIFSIF